MHPERIWTRFQDLARHYRKEMERYTWEEFNRKPSAASWSLGEMYEHVIETGYLQLDSLHACLREPENRTAQKTAVGRLVYFLGSIPPVKAKVPPSAEGTARPPASKEELLRKMDVLQRRMEETLPLVSSASPYSKIRHPYFGFINAKEWYHHLVMHMAHHLRQKKRLDRFLGKG
ncbi:DinB family protein [Gorillibacterium sp. sgz5001074]|uniref:DinB family protein n=1 Tax=Gorillibacterium sp. sgz5001074 TaxID=3446695 RepID=UPI003F674F95